MNDTVDANQPKAADDIPNAHTATNSADLIYGAVAQFLGKKEIDWDKLKPVISFVVLWNRLEAATGCYVTLPELKARCAATAGRKQFDLSKYMPQIRFFQERYTTHRHFLPELFRSDRPKEVLAERAFSNFIAGEKMTNQETLESLLFAPYRVRNNLFHGRKDTADLYAQTSLFENVNQVLFQFHRDRQ